MSEISSDGIMFDLVVLQGKSNFSVSIKKKMSIIILIWIIFFWLHNWYKKRLYIVQNE